MTEGSTYMGTTVKSVIIEMASANPAKAGTDVSTDTPAMLVPPLYFATAFALRPKTITVHKSKKAEGTIWAWWEGGDCQWESDKLGVQGTHQRRQHEQSKATWHS